MHTKPPTPRLRQVSSCASVKPTTSQHPVQKMIRLAAAPASGAGATGVGRCGRGRRRWSSSWCGRRGGRRSRRWSAVPWVVAGAGLSGWWGGASGGRRGRRGGGVHAASSAADTVSPASAHHHARGQRPDGELRISVYRRPSASLDRRTGEIQAAVPTTSSERSARAIAGTAARIPRNVAARTLSGWAPYRVLSFHHTRTTTSSTSAARAAT